MAKKPTKPKAAKRIMRTLKPGEKIEDSGTYQSDMSKKRATFVAGELAPPAPLKGERWRQVFDPGMMKK